MQKMNLNNYDYRLPEKLIAREPAIPRSSSRLLVYDTRNDQVFFDIFENISKYLPKNSLLVFNDTKVLPARLKLKKDTGGIVEILLFVNEFHVGDEYIRGFADRKINISQKLFFDDSKEAFSVVGQDENIFKFKPSFDISKLNDFLFKYGSTPIPKYIGDTKMNEGELRERYQSVWAKTPSSIAAPTASLHFTPEVLENIKRSGVDNTFVTLNVGIGTFAPVTEENISEKRLHKEFYEISRESAGKIKNYKDAGRKIIPVGTTATRALESAADGILSGGAKISAETEIFIFPPYDFKIANGLITNFHIPKSSLMCLVDAFLKYKGAKRGILDLYEIAIKEKFRFYSFGDAMLIL